jgi:hypothetical protein
LWAIDGHARFLTSLAQEATFQMAPLRGRLSQRKIRTMQTRNPHLARIGFDKTHLDTPSGPF